MQNIGGAKYSMPPPQPNYWRGHGPPGPPLSRPPWTWSHNPALVEVKTGGRHPLNTVKRIVRWSKKTICFISRLKRLWFTLQRWSLYETGGLIDDSGRRTERVKIITELRSPAPRVTERNSCHLTWLFEAIKSINCRRMWGKIHHCPIKAGKQHRLAKTPQKTLK